MYNEQLIKTLSLLLVITSAITVEARDLRAASHRYLAQALVIVLLLLAFAQGNPALYMWAGVALVTKAIIIPWLLLHYVRRIGSREVPAIVGAGPSLLIAAVIMGIFYALVYHNVHFLAPTAQAALGVFRLNLAVALTVFVLGLYAIISRRDAIKTVIGLCLLENAVHLSLVSLAPGASETALIGMATEVVLTVALLLYVISGISERFGSTDTYELSELRW